MANSFGEQFLKMGLVDKKKLKSAKKQKHQQAVQQSKQGDISESKQVAQREKQQKQQRDRELNLKRQQLAEKKAIAAQIKQLIEINKIKPVHAEIKYNFTLTDVNEKQLIKSINVTAEISDQLSNGVLALVSNDDHYLLIPSAVASKIAERDDSCIVVFNQSKSEKTHLDDPYADYQIPDDLMW